MADTQAPMNPYQSPDGLTGDLRSADIRKTWVLALTVAVSLACALGAALLSIPHRGGPYAESPVTWVILAMNALFGALLGFALAAIAKACAHRDWRVLMPGHWRALETLTVLVGIVASLRWHGQPGFTVGISAFFMEQLAMDTARNLAGVLLFLSVALFNRERLVWKAYAWNWLFIYAANLMQIPVALYNARADIGAWYLIVGIVPWISAIGILSAALMLIIGVIIDVRDRVPRDLGHFAGIILPIASYAIAVLARLFL